MQSQESGSPSTLLHEKDWPVNVPGRDRNRESDGSLHGLLAGKAVSTSIERRLDMQNKIAISQPPSASVLQTRVENLFGP